MEILFLQVVLKNTYFLSAYRQGHGSVEILPPVIHRLSIAKDLCFKVLDHVLHNFTENKMQQINHTNAWDIQTTDLSHVRGCWWNKQVCIPIDPPGAFLRLDVDVVMVDLQFGDFHLEEVGLELDCPAHGAEVRPWWWLEHIFWHRGRWGVWNRGVKWRKATKHTIRIT